MKTKTFEDFLKEKHAEQYTGLDDEMIDNCGDWFYNEIRRQDIVKYADEYASQQKQEMAEKIEDSINLHKILKLNCKDNDKIEKKEAHDIVIEAFKKLKQNQTK